MSEIGRQLGAWIGTWLGQLVAALSNNHKDICIAIVRVLEGGSWVLVRRSRIPLMRQVWSYLMVYCDHETSAKLTYTSQTGIARIKVVGKLRLVDAETTEDRMDELAAEIETRLTEAALRTRLQGFESLTLISTALVVREGAGRTVGNAEVITEWDVGYALSDELAGMMI